MFLIKTSVDDTLNLQVDVSIDNSIILIHDLMENRGKPGGVHLFSVCAAGLLLCVAYSRVISGSRETSPVFLALDFRYYQLPLAGLIRI